jgi:hypothetical protein
MVLAHHGDIRTEAELRVLLDTQSGGTRVGNMMHLSGPAFEVYLRPSSLVELQAVLATNQPPIVFLKTGHLQYWSMDIAHTAVVIAVDATTVTLNDPYFAAAPQITSLQTFEKAWAETGQFTAFIRRRKQPLPPG